MRGSRTIDWPGYLSRFHAERPGITEDVLAACTADGRTPYDWLVADLDPRARHLDLACGSGPTHRPEATRWVGVDRSAGELEAAARHGRGPLVRADVAGLPVAAGSVEVVTCSMAMMLVAPVEPVLAEARRVLADGGELHLLLPTRGPLAAGDVARYLRLFLAARSPTRFPPTRMRQEAVGTLEAAGFVVHDDESRRFSLRLDDTSAAARFVASWYLPGVSPARLAAAQRRAGAMVPCAIGVPLRRIVARRA